MYRDIALSVRVLVHDIGPDDVQSEPAVIAPRSVRFKCDMLGASSHSHIFNHQLCPPV